MSEPERVNQPGDQALPVVNDSSSIQSLVRADLDEREQVGIQRYGTPLQAFNGRDVDRDLYEELLDAACYMRQRIQERPPAYAGDSPTPEELRERISLKVMFADMRAAADDNHADSDECADAAMSVIGPVLADKDAEIERVISVAEDRMASARADALRAHDEWREVKEASEAAQLRVAELTRERDRLRADFADAVKARPEWVAGWESALAEVDEWAQRQAERAEQHADEPAAQAFQWCSSFVIVASNDPSAPGHLAARADLQSGRPVAQEAPPSGPEPRPAPFRHANGMPCYGCQMCFANACDDEGDFPVPSGGDPDAG